MVPHNGPPCTRPGFGLQCMAEIWFLGTADQPTFAALQQFDLTSVIPLQSALYLQ